MKLIWLFILLVLIMLLTGKGKQPLFGTPDYEPLTFEELNQ